jgi:hypothetical protein
MRSSNIARGLPGVPAQFSKKTQNSEQFDIVKGSLNKLRLRPQIQNEYAESSREAMDVVDATTVVGQMFKASEDNINGISLTLESAAAFASMDAITAGGGENKSGTQEYSGDAALQAEWIKSGAVEATRSAHTDSLGTTQDGSYACKAPMTTLGDDWRVTLTSTDLTGVTFSIKFAQSVSFAVGNVYFFVGDGTNTKSFPLPVGATDVWQTFEIEETSMTVTANDDTVTTPNMAAITKMGLRIDKKAVGGFAYADSITYQAEPGSVDLELWDMGASLPASNGTVDYTSKDQYTELGDRGIAGGVASSINLPLRGGKRKYHIDAYVAGVALEIAANNILTTGNYYAILLKYNDTDVTVYGPDTTLSTNYYTSGYAWSADTGDNLIDVIPGAAGAGAYSDLMFQVFSTQDVYITRFQILADAAPNGNADVSVFAEDSNMGISDIPISNQKGGMGRTEVSEDMTLAPPILKKGGKFEAYVNDDPTDDVTKILFTMDYMFIPPTTNL